MRVWVAAAVAMVCLASVAAGTPPPDAGRQPALGRTALLTLVGGRVTVRAHGAPAFVPLVAPALVAMPASVDAVGGRVRVTTATSQPARLQSAEFYAGSFRLSQAPTGATRLTLDAKLPCRRAGAARAHRVHVAARAPSRRLWGDGHGDFTTSGSYASATVLGTRWLTVEECGSTRVSVTAGAVRVTNLLTHQSRTLTGGQSYLAGFSLAGISYPQPDPANVTENVRLYWQGQPRFPVHGLQTPLAGCSGPGFNCGNYTAVFRHPHDPLVWRNGAGCTSSYPVDHVGSWAVTLTDARGITTDVVVRTQHCVGG